MQDNIYPLQDLILISDRTRFHSNSSGAQLPTTRSLKGVDVLNLPVLKLPVLPNAWGNQREFREVKKKSLILLDWASELIHRILLQWLKMQRLIIYNGSGFRSSSNEKWQARPVGQDPQHLSEHFCSQKALRLNLLLSLATVTFARTTAAPLSNLPCATLRPNSGECSNLWFISAKIWEVFQTRKKLQSKKLLTITAWKGACPFDLNNGMH